MSTRVVEEKQEKIIRPDAPTKYKSVVVDRVGSTATLTRAARQLSRSHKPQRVLVVPGKSLNAAKKAMHEIGVSGTVRNMKDTHRIYVSTPASNSTKLKK